MQSGLYGLRFVDSAGYGSITLSALYETKNYSISNRLLHITQHDIFLFVVSNYY